MSWTYTEADTYFTNEVLHNQSWLDANVNARNRALKNADNELYEYYRTYDRTNKPIPNKAIYEQAIWLLRKDDNILRSEQGVTNVNLSGAIQMTISGNSPKVSPAVVRILGRRKGRYR